MSKLIHKLCEYEIHLARKSIGLPTHFFSEKYGQVTRATDVITVPITFRLYSDIDKLNEESGRYGAYIIIRKNAYSIYCLGQDHSNKKYKQFDFYKISEVVQQLTLETQIEVAINASIKHERKNTNESFRQSDYLENYKRHEKLVRERYSNYRESISSRLRCWFIDNVSIQK